MNSLRNLAAQARLPHARKTRRRALFAIPLLGVLALALLWAVIVMRLSVEKESAYREAAASAAILSTALEQHTVKAIHQVDQITRFVKFEFEKSPDHFNLASTVEKGVVPSDTLIQVSLVNAQGQPARQYRRNPSQAARPVRPRALPGPRQRTTTTSSSSAARCSAASRATGRCR